MIEKIFGRKSTGIVYLVSAGLILLSLTAYVLLYVLRYFSSGSISLMRLIGYAVFSAMSLGIMTLPVLAQKRYKVYVPAFIEILLCIFAVVYLTSEVMRAKRPDTGTFFPLLGGAVLSMAVFSPIYTAFWRRAKRNKKPCAAFLCVLATFVLTFALTLVWHLSEYIVALTFYRNAPGVVVHYLTAASMYGIGNLMFCVTGYFLIRFGGADAYRLKSFRDTDEAKKAALTTRDKAFYKVIDNDERDQTDYRGLYLSAKTKYYLGKIVYFSMYAGYLVYLIFFYYNGKILNTVFIFSLIAAFLLNGTVAIYEYRLARTYTPKTRRLRFLKVAKSAVRLFALFLTVAVLLQADFSYNELTAVTSVVMIFVNLVSFVNNLYRGSKRAFPIKQNPQDPSDEAQADKIDV